MRAFELKLEEIVAMVQPVKQAGTTTESIKGVAGIDVAQAGQLAFLENTHSIGAMATTKYEKYVAGCQASVLLLPKDFAAPEPKPGQMYLFVEKPSLAFGMVCGRIEQMLYPRPTAGIHPTAVVDREAKVHPSVHIGPNCVVGVGVELHKGVVLHSGVIVRAHATIGVDTEVKSGVVIAEDTVIGARCIIQSGAVIGSDGFGYVFHNGQHVKIPQIGNVVIEDRVEIGANTTIDRARFGSTVVGAGSKLDNLIQVAHNVKIGRGCLLAAMVALAGGAVLEDWVVMGGQSGVGGNTTVGTQTKVAAQSAVMASVGPKQTLVGKPARDLNTVYRTEALKNKLPSLYKRVQKIEDTLGIKEIKKDSADEK